MVVTRWLVTAILSTSVLIASVTAQARTEVEKDPFDGRLLPVELVMQHRKEIGLSSEQSKRIGELVVAVQRAVAEKQWQMQSAYFELLEVLDEPEIDEERALALTRRAVDTENEIKLEQVRLLIRLRNLLLPEQVAYLRAQLAGGPVG